MGASVVSGSVYPSLEPFVRHPTSWSLALGNVKNKIKNLVPAVWEVIFKHRWTMCVLAQAAVTESHRLGLKQQKRIFSQFWDLEIQAQGFSWFDFW